MVRKGTGGMMEFMVAETRGGDTPYPRIVKQQCMLGFISFSSPFIQSGSPAQEDGFSS